MAVVMGKRKAGMGIAVTLVGMLLAASTGIVGATVVTMGLLALPTMLKRGYSAQYSCGIITATGTLGADYSAFYCLSFTRRCAIEQLSTSTIEYGDFLARNM